MRLILTHEQADFDAIASLLCASLLDNLAIPVLPRRLNRNVRSYIALYGQELPFVDARDLPPGKIEAVTLVDTQSLVTIKGMHKATKVRIIDHHPVRQDIPPDWDVTIGDTGSTTTLLAELSSEEQLSLSLLQATLLLLGIYEDTGSLTYTSTTGRDGRAAAYLMDQGANLQIAANFLNPPLSSEQRIFYDLLSANAKIHHINGHRIVISSGDLVEFNEEISTLAHKLRDLLDPDGLFVIVSTVEGIRLVARSTSHQIDVGAIANHFGGGGHDRAAAALIRGAEANDNQVKIEEITRELLAILPDFVKPSITVSQIMSKSPHVLASDTPVYEASRLMQYYGYEGYPVVKNGKVIGLLTRRAVDKALNHKLNLTAASLMEANEVWVRPDDSIQHLQTLMAESGWGQIPVIDPNSGEMIGIVTRTDLLKMLSPKASGKNRVNLEVKLTNTFPPRMLALIRSIAQEAISQKSAIYIVGGFVRDLILERPSMDFDLVVEGDAIQVAKNAASKLGGRVTVHSRFGTAKWYLPESYINGEDVPSFLDFITARLEFYAHPTALPTIERSSIKFDLHRRDFTINTLAIRLDGVHFGELYDFWGGQNDLKDQQIRVLHSLSFIDDPTRMLRAVRFEQRFGFQIENRTLNLMLDAKGLLTNLSGDRIRHEFNLIMDELDCAGIFSRLDDLGLLKAIHPSLPWNDLIYIDLHEKIDQNPFEKWGQKTKVRIQSDRRTMGYLLWLSNLAEADVIPVCRRLRLPDSIKKNILAIQEISFRLPDLYDSPPSKICFVLDDFPLTALYITFLKVQADSANILEKYILQWRMIKPKTTGDDLIKIGLPTGPIYQEILERLRSAWLDGDVNSLEKEKILLDGMVRGMKLETE
jgi:tRNA nucleotidyltransferase (CCA-adding enzyme)